MKRANQLQPLSRQHHLGLHVARHAKEYLDNPQEISDHWQALSSYMSDMRNHFKVEDNLLVDALHPYRSTQPEVASVLDKLDTQHKLLHKLTADIQASTETEASLPTVAQVRELANMLYDHVRFEERELFPIAEQCLTVEQLNAIYKASPDDIKHLDEQR
ncbi:hemerythrin domain-containing protein [Psychrobacter frigidicola]|uniref:hemerythrin domain-containing protein n=1 Tax=Psychrobacter frigidicola TaxID=45611 RepID=UPI00191A695D|nr:hemerythrin domain-containing protein [Psychrobacter frigidicola]